MTQNKKNLTDSLTETDLSEIIQMALSDHVTFSEIESQYGLREDQVKKIMRKNIKPSSSVSYTHLTLPTNREV